MEMVESSIKGAGSKTCERAGGGGGMVRGDHRRCRWSHQGQDLRGQAPDGFCACSTLCPRTWYGTAYTRWRRRLIGWEGIWERLSAANEEGEKGEGMKRKRCKMKGKKYPAKWRWMYARPVGQLASDGPVASVHAGGVAD